MMEHGVEAPCVWLNASQCLQHRGPALDRGDERHRFDRVGSARLEGDSVHHGKQSAARPLIGVRPVTPQGGVDQRFDCSVDVSLVEHPVREIGEGPHPVSTGPEASDEHFAPPVEPRPDGLVQGQGYGRVEQTHGAVGAAQLKGQDSGSSAPVAPAPGSLAQFRSANQGRHGCRRCSSSLGQDRRVVEGDGDALVRPGGRRRQMPGPPLRLLRQHVRECGVSGLTFSGAGGLDQARADERMAEPQPSVRDVDESSVHCW
jgi:hypothetical protein